MWKNQILYKPEYYGQYTGKKNSVLIDMKYMQPKYFDSFVVIICNLSILQQSTTECLQWLTRVCYLPEIQANGTSMPDHKSIQKLILRSWMVSILLIFFLKGIKLRIKLYFQKYKKITALNVFFFRGPLHAFKVHELQYGHKVCSLYPKHSMLCRLFYAYHSLRTHNNWKIKLWCTCIQHTRGYRRRNWGFDRIFNQRYGVQWWKRIVNDDTADWLLLLSTFISHEKNDYTSSFIDVWNLQAKNHNFLVPWCCHNQQWSPILYVIIKRKYKF